MIWGHTGAEQTGSSIRSAVQSMAMHGYANVLGFNVPDNSSQTLTGGFFANFSDVTQSDIFHGYVETIFRNGITAGCGGGDYCPADPVTRAQMAVFLLKTHLGSGYAPPPCGGVFEDVPCPSQFADWIEDLSTRGITAGCSASPPLYCPASPNTRGQMAVFLVKTFFAP